MKVMMKQSFKANVGRAFRAMFAGKSPVPAPVSKTASVAESVIPLPIQVPRAGELWLHDRSGQPQCALPRSIYQAGLACSDNKLIMGPAGSGRSMLLTKLSHCAHQAGNQVVIIQTTNYFSNLQHFTICQDGAVRRLVTPQQASFNPFILPATHGSYGLANAVVKVGNLLLLLLRSVQPLPEVRLARQQLLQCLITFLKRDSSAPDFNAFFEFVQLDAAQAGLAPEQQAFHEWFFQAASPYYRGGQYDHLLNATATQLAALVQEQNRLLFFDIKLDDSFREAGTYPQDWAPMPAPLSLQRVLWLLLHTIDLFHGRAHGVDARPLTVVVDELHYAALGPLSGEYFEDYMRDSRTYWREVLVAWHESPASVFRPEHPAVGVLCRHFDCLLLLPSRLHNSSHYTPLYQLFGFGSVERMCFKSLNSREVMVRAGSRAQAYQVVYTPAEVQLYSRFTAPRRGFPTP